MPDPIETLPAEPAAPAAEPTEAERMEAVFETATAEADAQEPAPPAGDGDESAVAEEPVDGVPEPEVAAAEPPAAAEPEQPAVPLTPEEQDEVDAKALGFKNQRANKEFKELRGIKREYEAVKEKLPELEQRASQWGEMHGYLTQNKITPERFKQGMTMTAALSSDDPAILAKAREGLQWELRELNKRLGIAGDGYDPLTETTNADLAEAVRNEEMTPERAQAIARERVEAAHYRTQHQQSQEQQTAATARSAAVTAAAEELNELERKYKAVDPRYDEKAELLIDTLKPLFEDIDPKLWASKFEKAYLALKLKAPAPTQATAAPARPAPLRNQPLRASAMPPGGAAAPATSPDDIMRKALEQAAAMDGVPFRG